MKLLILLLIIQIPIASIAIKKSKPIQYFALGSSLDWNLQKTKTKQGSVNNTQDTNFTIGFAKGYIFHRHWDLSVAVQFKQFSVDKTISNNPKSYSAMTGVKYIFDKSKMTTQYYHRNSMTPYLGLAFKWTQFSPYLQEGQTAKTTELSPMLLAGLRYFMTSNLAISGDISYHFSYSSTKVSGNVLKTNKTEIEPHIRFIYFY